jgi:hypothetical protein
MKAQEAIKQAGNITIPECPELEKNASVCVDIHLS